VVIEVVRAVPCQFRKIVSGEMAGKTVDKVSNLHIIIYILHTAPHYYSAGIGLMPAYDVERVKRVPEYLV
jgi:hypothetical protein